MTATATELLRDAMTLTPTDRAELIEALLRTFDGDVDQRSLEVWRAEAESRIDAFDAGKLTDTSAQAMFERIKQR
jgi:putative addiction module component (TIGR02574 family)